LAEPDETRRVSSPAALIAVVAVAAMVAILCVLGAMFSGLFGAIGFTTAAADNTAGVSVAGVDAASPKAAATRVEDGQWLVATDIAAGTYTATVPEHSGGCAWERNSSSDGTVNSVLESGVGRAGERMVVSIKVTDVIFKSRGCGVWQRTGD
jgi:hypothetical protein